MSMLIFSNFSIEDDFITWKDKFWPAVCEHFHIESTGDDVNVRQYKLTEHTDPELDKVYTGEVARIHSFKIQRPYVFSFYENFIKNRRTFNLFSVTRNR